MTRKCALWLLATLLPVAAWASIPGEPYDCSDWVFLMPGLSCEDFNPFPGSTGFFEGGDGMQVDNEGNIYAVFLKGSGEVCGSQSLGEIRLMKYNGPNAEIIAYLREKCDPISGEKDRLVFSSGGLAFPLFFDRINGRMIVPLETQLGPSVGGCDPCSGKWIVAIRGFTTVFEILQTYTPPSGPISFTVPAHPEGFERADWFDTYYIPITHPVDFSLAQPLLCGYPPATPQAGDFLTVPDTAPPLSPGQGYFYVTAASYQGERRYGRQTIGGVKTGRDPAVLPGCSN